MGGMMQQCMQRQEAMMTTMSQVIATMEQARQSNDPARMRAALDQATRQMRIMHQQMQANMSQMRQMQAQMHGGMHGQMRGMMGQHGGGAGMMGPTAGLQQRLDTACGGRVDLATAPRATYMGKTYYFCSDADRRAFERDPERFLRERGMR